MKIVAKDIEMVCWFNSEGVTPIKFRYSEDDGSEKVIKVDRVISNQIEKLCGNLCWVYDCQSVIDDVEKLYQLKYFISETRWILFKI